MSNHDKSITGKCFIIVTGASRGFGQQIAELVASAEDGIFQSVSPGSQIILMSRDEQGLAATKQTIDQLKSGLDVKVVALDLTDTQSVKVVVEDMLNQNCVGDFEHAILFSNAGTLGDPHKSLPEYTDMHEVERIYKLNVVSPSYLIGRFCAHFGSAAKQLWIVNTSSLAALQPMRSSGMYSTSKCAMDMYLRNLVADCPQIRALNYAPGPLDTEMARALRDGSGDEGTRNYFIDLFSTGKILSARDSAKKLMMLLRKNEFGSGDHIDFYDV